MIAPLLDTHIWIWYVADQSKLQRREVEALDALDLDNRPFISDFSLWEVGTLAGLGRLQLGQSLQEWLSSATKPSIVRFLPFSVEIAVELASLPDRLHRDPADRAIVATARVNRLPLLTRDQRILSSGLVQRWKPKPAAKEA
jgi:PIN domain nuclease of toxin-antitoxin system